MSESAPKNVTRDLAATIYAGLVTEAAEVSGEGVKMATSAENLAKLSLKLAEVFAQVEEDAREAKKPAKNTSLDAASIADWMKK